MSDPEYCNQIDDDFKKVEEESQESGQPLIQANKNYKKKCIGESDEEEEYLKLKQKKLRKKKNVLRSDSECSSNQDRENKEMERKEVEAQMKAEREWDHKLNKPQQQEDGTKVYTAKDDFYLAQQDLLKLFIKRVQKQPKRFEEKEWTGNRLQEEKLFNSDIEHPYLEFMRENYKKNEYEKSYSEDPVQRFQQDSKSKSFVIVQYERINQVLDGENLTWEQKREKQNLPKHNITNLKIQIKSQKDKKFSQKFNGYIDSTNLYDRLIIVNDSAYFYSKNWKDDNILKLELQRIELSDNNEAQDLSKYAIEIKNIPDIFECDFCFINPLSSDHSQELDDQYLFFQNKKAFYVFSLKDTKKPIIEKQFEIEKELEDMFQDSYFIKKEDNSTVFILNKCDESYEISLSEQNGNPKENLIEFKEFQQQDEMDENTDNQRGENQRSKAKDKKKLAKRKKKFVILKKEVFDVNQKKYIQYFHFKNSDYDEINLIHPRNFEKEAHIKDQILNFCKLEKYQKQEVAIDLTDFKDPKLKIYSKSYQQKPNILFDGFYFYDKKIIYDEDQDDNQKQILKIENIFQENEIHSYNVNRHKKNVFSGRNIGIVGNEIFIFGRNFLLLDFSDSGQFFVINLFKDQRIKGKNNEEHSDQEIQATKTKTFLNYNLQMYKIGDQTSTFFFKEQTFKKQSKYSNNDYRTIYSQNYTEYTEYFMIQIKTETLQQKIQDKKYLFDENDGNNFAYFDGFSFDFYEFGKQNNAIDIFSIISFEKVHDLALPYQNIVVFQYNLQRGKFQDMINYLAVFDANKQVLRCSESYSNLEISFSTQEIQKTSEEQKQDRGERMLLKKRKEDWEERRFNRERNENSLDDISQKREKAFKQFLLQAQFCIRKTKCYLNPSTQRLIIQIQVLQNFKENQTFLNEYEAIINRYESNQTLQQAQFKQISSIFIGQTNNQSKKIQKIELISEIQSDLNVDRSQKQSESIILITYQKENDVIKQFINLNEQTNYVYETSLFMAFWRIKNELVVIHVYMQKKCLKSNYFDFKKTQNYIDEFLKYTLTINLSDQESRNFFQPQIISFGKNKFFQLIQDSKEDNIFVNNLKEQFELLESSQENLTFLDGSVIEMLFRNDEVGKKSFAQKLELNAHFDFICNFEEHESMIKCFYDKKLYKQISYIMDFFKMNPNYHKYILRYLPFIIQNLSPHYDLSEFFSLKQDDPQIFKLCQAFSQKDEKDDNDKYDGYRRQSDKCLGENKTTIESALDQEDLSSKKDQYFSGYRNRSRKYDSREKGFIYLAYYLIQYLDNILSFPYEAFSEAYEELSEKVELECKEINFKESTVQINIDFVKDNSNDTVLLEDQNNEETFGFTKQKLLKLFNCLRNDEKIIQKSLFQEVINYLFETSENLIFQYLGVYIFGFVIPFMYHLSQIQHCSHDLNVCRLSDLIPLKQEVSIFWNYIELLKFISMVAIQVQYIFVLYYEINATGYELFIQNIFNIFDFAQPLSFFAHLLLCFQYDINQPGHLLMIIILLRIIIVLGIANRTLKYLKCYKQSCLIYHIVWNTLKAITPSLITLQGFNIIFSFLLMIIKGDANGNEHQQDYTGLSYPIQTFIQIFRLSLRDIETFQLDSNWKEHGSGSSLNVMLSLIWVLWFFILAVNSIVILNLMIVQGFNAYENVSEHAISLVYKERIDVNIQIFKILEQQFGIQEKFCALLIRKPLEIKLDNDENIDQSISEEIKRTTQKQIDQLQGNLETFIQKSLAKNDLDLKNQQ